MHGVEWTVAGIISALVVAGWLIVDRLREQRFKQLLLSPDSTSRPKLDPESTYVVTVADNLIACVNPDGVTVLVDQGELQRVEIVTTDQGPFLPDVFWVLHDARDTCVIPWGATGESSLLTLLQALPEFDNQAMIQAAGSTSNRRFLCWQRPFK